MHEIPVGMSNGDIRVELIAQNETDMGEFDVKVIYVYPSKPNIKTTIAFWRYLLWHVN